MVVAVYRSARNMYKTHRAPHRLYQLMNNISYCNVLAIAIYDIS